MGDSPLELQAPSTGRPLVGGHTLAGCLRLQAYLGVVLGHKVLLGARCSPSTNANRMFIRHGHLMAPYVRSRSAFRGLKC